MPLQTLISTLKSQEAYIKAKGIAHVFLFGSYSRGEEHEQSDIDLIYTRDNNNTLNLKNFQAVKTHLRKKLGKSIDLLGEHSLHPLFAKAIEGDKVLVF